MNDNQRTITLPTIPKEVAEAIVWARSERGESISDIIERYTSTSYRGPNTDALRLVPLDTLLSALVNGYVVEKSAEEQAYADLRGAYTYNQRRSRSIDDRYDGYADGIRYTLDTLGIKIEGVNA